MKNRSVKIFLGALLMCIVVIILICIPQNKENYTKYIKEIYKNDETLRIHEENNIVYVINSLSGDLVKEVADVFIHKNIKPDKKIIFCTNLNVDGEVFFDENIKGIIETNSSKINYSYVNMDLIERKNEVKLPFEVKEIKEEDKKIYISIDITGGEKTDIVGEAKLITEEILNVNNIKNSPEVITQVNTKTLKYEFSNLHENIIKISN